MTDSTAVSLKIISSGWGKMEVEELGRGKDFKLWPGGGKPWDWSVYGTGHKAGIQPLEVEDLVRGGCRIVVLTTGRLKRLTIPVSTIKTLEEQGVEVIVCATKKGIRLYNEYAKRGYLVGGLFHSTC